MQVTVAHMVYITDKAYTGWEVRECEVAMLRAIEYRCSVPTVYTFMTRLLKIIDSTWGKTPAAASTSSAAGDASAGGGSSSSSSSSSSSPSSSPPSPLSAVKCMAQYISERSLLEYSLLLFPPSMVAAASAFIALRTFLPVAAGGGGCELPAPLLAHYAATAAAPPSPTPSMAAAGAVASSSVSAGRARTATHLSGIVAHSNVAAVDMEAAAAVIAVLARPGSARGRSVDSGSSGSSSSNGMGTKPQLPSAESLFLLLNAPTLPAAASEAPSDDEPSPQDAWPLSLVLATGHAFPTVGSQFAQCIATLEAILAGDLASHPTTSAAAVRRKYSSSRYMCMAHSRFMTHTGAWRSQPAMPLPPATVPPAAPAPASSPSSAASPTTADLRSSGATATGFSAPSSTTAAGTGQANIAAAAAAATAAAAAGEQAGPAGATTTAWAAHLRAGTSKPAGAAVEKIRTASSSSTISVGSVDVSAIADADTSISTQLSVIGCDSESTQPAEGFGGAGHMLPAVVAAHVVPPIGASCGSVVGGSSSGGASSSHPGYTVVHEPGQGEVLLIHSSP